jgi:HlyD family type I secretion membrane fusion protein
MTDTSGHNPVDPVRNIELELGGGALETAIRGSTILIILTLVAVVVWSLLAKVDELARARGEIKPLGEIQIVESRDGGRIERLLVREGDRVNAGDTIAIFDRTRSETELKVAQAKQAALEMEIERYTAFADGREADFQNYVDAFPFLVTRETGAFVAQQRLRDAEVGLAEQKLLEKRAELAALETEIPAIEAEKEATEKALAIYRRLAEKQLTSKVQEADAIQKDASIARELAVARGRRELLRSEIVELQQSVEQVRRRFIAEALEKRAASAVELREVQDGLADLEERVSETVVKSPVTGIVQSIPATRVGEVIEPGEKVAEIVPGDEALELVVRLMPRDIGFVRTGQPAKVKIDAFDSSRYGTLDGTVERVSPTTFIDERGVAYYEVHVVLDKSYFGETEDQFALVPGMTGEADIKTGVKTVFQYMWKPIYTNLDVAFSER